MAKCTAPGHPSCTITCPNGCGALYVEPNGPCRTMCSGGKLEIAEGESFSIQISELPAGDLAEMLGDAAPAELTERFRGSSQKISYQGTHDSARELLEAIARQI